MGDFPRNPLVKPGYDLVFEDDFDQGVLDLEKWIPAYLPQWSTREQARPRYTFAESALVLQIEADQMPWCPEYDGNIRCSSIQTGLYAGPVGSPLGQHHFKEGLVVREAQPTQRTFTPQYGYFEARVKADNRPGSLSTIWMIGFEDVPEHSGEIAMFELFGDPMSATTAEIRYGVHPWGDETLEDDYFHETLSINAADYHIYAVEWAPTHIDFYVDNVKQRTVEQAVAYPMQFMIGVYDLTGTERPQEPPRQFHMDYFRGYQPADGY